MIVYFVTFCDFLALNCQRVISGNMAYALRATAFFSAVVAILKQESQLSE